MEIKTLDDLDVLLREARKIIESGKIATVEIEIPAKTRTIPQNKALHLYCKQLAEKMTGAGYTQRQLIGKFKEGFELPVTEHMIKDIFREVGRAMFKEESTTGLTTVQTQKVYQIVDLRFREITGIGIEWPSKETQMMREYEQN